MDTKGGAGPLSPAKAAERLRRAEALRANLRRRKSAARKTTVHDPSDATTAPADVEADRPQ